MSSMQSQQQTKGEVIAELRGKTDNFSIKDIGANGIKIENNDVGQITGKYQANFMETVSIHMKTDGTSEPFARTVGLHVNTDCLHEVGLVFARDLAYVVVLYLDAVSADVFDAEVVGLTAQLGDYLAFGLLLRLHTTHLRMRERPLFERLYPRNTIRLLQGAECFEYSFLNQNPKR